jgi:hypothetical protein
MLYKQFLYYVMIRCYTNNSYIKLWSDVIQTILILSYDVIQKITLICVYIYKVDHIFQQWQMDISR